HQPQPAGHRRDHGSRDGQPRGSTGFQDDRRLTWRRGGRVVESCWSTQGGSGIPFAIEGTTSNPKFILDVGGAVAGAAKDQIRNAATGQVPGAGNVTKGLGGILGKKKP